MPAAQYQRDAVRPDSVHGAGCGRRSGRALCFGLVGAVDAGCGTEVLDGPLVIDTALGVGVRGVKLEKLHLTVGMGDSSGTAREQSE